jgi:hypothetical protein
MLGQLRPFTLAGGGTLLLAVIAASQVVLLLCAIWAVPMASAEDADAAAATVSAPLPLPAPLVQTLRHHTPPHAAAGLAVGPRRCRGSRWHWCALAPRRVPHLGPGDAVRQKQARARRPQLDDGDGQSAQLSR